MSKQTIYEFIQHFIDGKSNFIKVVDNTLIINGDIAVTDTEADFITELLKEN